MRNCVAVLTLLFATLLFGSSNVVQKSVLGSLDLWSALGYRGSIAFLVLLPFAVRELRQLSLGGRDVLVAGGPTAIWFTLGMVSQMLGAGLTSATNLGFLINMCVIFVPLLVWIQSGRLPSSFVAGIALLCFLGASIMTGSAPTSFGIGDAFCVVSALSYSGWIIALGRLMRTANVPVTITCLQWLGPACIGVALSPHDSVAMANAVAVGGELLFLGVVVSGVGFLLAARAQKYLTASTAAVCYSMEAVFGAVIAAVWLHERLSLTGLFGAALVLASIVLVQLEPRPLPQRERVEPRLT
jgi:drug/metabolite transporter (DMT)-like permease